MSIAIPSSLAGFVNTTEAAGNSRPSPSEASSPPEQETAAQTTLQSNNQQAGFVRLTQAQQVQQLYSDGHTVPQIAFRLELSAQAVDRYLNISALKG